MRTYHHEVPGPITVILQILSGTALGVLVAAGYLVLKPVASNEARAAGKKGEGAVAERNVVTYTPGNPGNPSGQQWRVRERAFLERSPTGVALSEVDINRWMSATYGSAERRMTFPSIGLEVVPDLPLVRLDGTEMHVGMAFHCKIGGADKAIVAQARGAIDRAGGSTVFRPSRVYLGSCPLPGPVGSMLLDRIGRGYPVSEDTAAAWKAVTSAKLEDSQLKLAFH